MKVFKTIPIVGGQRIVTGILFYSTTEEVGHLFNFKSKRGVYKNHGFTECSNFRVDEILSVYSYNKYLVLKNYIL